MLTSAGLCVPKPVQVAIPYSDESRVVLATLPNGDEITVADARKATEWLRKGGVLPTESGKYILALPQAAVATARFWDILKDENYVITGLAETGALPVVKLAKCEKLSSELKLSKAKNRLLLSQQKESGLKAAVLSSRD